MYDHQIYSGRDDSDYEAVMNSAKSDGYALVGFSTSQDAGGVVCTSAWFKDIAPEPPPPAPITAPQPNGATFHERHLWRQMMKEQMLKNLQANPVRKAK